MSADMTHSARQRWERLPRFGEGIGLDRIEHTIAGNRLAPALATPIRMGIVGTNGKGSVVRILSAACRKLGIRTVRFLSPHIRSLEERIALNDVPVQPALFDRLVDKAMMMAQRTESERPELGRFGQFEILFLAALVLATKERPDALIFEAGIGGRYDPVRLIRAGIVALVSVDYEHTELLGDTLGDIVRDKMDAAPAGGALVVPAELDPMAAVENYAQAKQLTVHRALPLSLAGDVAPFVPSNAGLAARILELITDRDGQSAQSSVTKALDDGALVLQLQPMRFRKWRVFIDGAHTPSSLAALGVALAGRGAPCIVGMSKGRDPGPLLACAMAVTAGHAPLIVVRPPERGAEPGVVMRTAKTLGLVDVRSAPGLEDALRHLGEPEGVQEVYIFGSLFLARQALNLLQEQAV